VTTKQEDNVVDKDKFEKGSLCDVIMDGPDLMKYTPQASQAAAGKRNSVLHYACFLPYRI
jgi:hypothetical protein